MYINAWAELYLYKITYKKKLVMLYGRIKAHLNAVLTKKPVSCCVWAAAAVNRSQEQPVEPATFQFPAQAFNH